MVVGVGWGIRAARQTDGSTQRRSVKKTDKYADRRTDRLTDNQTDRQINLILFAMEAW